MATPVEGRAPPGRPGGFRAGRAHRGGLGFGRLVGSHRGRPVRAARAGRCPGTCSRRGPLRPSEHLGPPTSDDFELAAPVTPDPRTFAGAPFPEAALTPPDGTKLCVACRAGHVDPDGYCENCGHAQPRERDHMEQELGSVAAVSDRGLRHHRNEDSFAVSTTALPDGSPAVVAIVCDGVSSASRPDEASAAAAIAANESLLESLPRGVHPQQAMHEAIVAAAESVNSLAVDPGQVEAMESRLFRPRPRRHSAGNAIGRSGDADGGSDNPCVSAARAPRKAFQRTDGDAAACHDGDAAGRCTECARRCPGT